MQRFLRDRLENVGIKRVSQKSAVVTQLLVSNNRYESPYAAAGPGFSPEAGAVFCSLRCGRRPASSADVFSKAAYSYAGRVEIRSAPMAPKSDQGNIGKDV